MIPDGVSSVATRPKPRADSSLLRLVLLGFATVRNDKIRVFFAGAHIVELGSTIYSDQAAHYNQLTEKYTHEVVNHLREYVRGSVHTNGMENFWSLLKRGLRGTYVAV